MVLLNTPLPRPVPAPKFAHQDWIVVAFVEAAPAVVLVDLNGRDNPAVDIVRTVDTVADIVDNRTFISLLLSNSRQVSFSHYPTCRSNRH